MPATYPSFFSRHTLIFSVSFFFLIPTCSFSLLLSFSHSHHSFLVSQLSVPWTYQVLVAEHTFNLFSLDNFDQLKAYSGCQLSLFTNLMFDFNQKAEFYSVFLAQTSSLFYLLLFGFGEIYLPLPIVQIIESVHSL